MQGWRRHIDKDTSLHMMGRPPLAFLVLLAVQLGAVQATARSAGGASGQQRYSATGAAPGNRGRQLGEASSRIVGGKAAAMGRYPYIVSLTKSGFHYCGGTLVTPNVVLTAAHCIFLGETITAEIGRYDRSKPAASDSEVRQINNVVVHPGWDGDMFDYDYDIALLFFLDPSTKTPVKLAPAAMKPPLAKDAITRAIGFGRLQDSQSSPLPRILQEVDMPYQEQSLCSSIYTTQLFKDSMVCAGPLSGGRDSCYGDSGGPLLVAGSDAGGDEQVGIVSFGDGCARPNRPGVYTSLYYYREWIASIIERWQPSNCPSCQSECEFCDSVSSNRCQLKAAGSACSLGVCSSQGVCRTEGAFMFGGIYWVPATSDDCGQACTAAGEEQYAVAVGAGKSFMCGYADEGGKFWEGSKLRRATACSGLSLNAGGAVQVFSQTTYFCGCGNGKEKFTFQPQCPEVAPHATWACRARGRKRQWFYGWIARQPDSTLTCMCRTCGAENTATRYQTMCTREVRTTDVGAKLELSN